MHCSSRLRSGRFSRDPGHFVTDLEGESQCVCRVPDGGIEGSLPAERGRTGRSVVLDEEMGCRSDIAGW